MENSQRENWNHHFCRNVSFLAELKNYSVSSKKLSETDIIQMFELLFDNRFAMIGGHCVPTESQHTYGH
jgi:hypothetical protein